MQVWSMVLSLPLLMVMSFSSAFGQDSYTGERRGANHLSLGFTQSFNLKTDSLERFSPAIYWQFHSSDGWRSGLGVESRVSSSDLESRRTLAMGQNFVHEHRLWSTFYMAPGFEIIWLYPTVPSERIFSKDQKRASEVGFGFSLGIINHFSATTTFELKLSRWRGIGSRNYQGFTGLLALSRYLGE
jgi:hypothetical protein